MMGSVGSVALSRGPNQTNRGGVTRLQVGYYSEHLDSSAPNERSQRMSENFTRYLKSCLLLLKSILQCGVAYISILQIPQV